VRGADNPLVFAGFVISNSETGHGSFKITPQICDNGLTLTQPSLTEVHLGGRLPTGGSAVTISRHRTQLVGGWPADVRVTRAPRVGDPCGEPDDRQEDAAPGKAGLRADAGEDRKRQRGQELTEAVGRLPGTQDAAVNLGRGLLQQQCAARRGEQGDTGPPGS
jgi:hypothetical protein